MIPSSRSGKGLQSKQEGDANDIKFSSKASSSSSRQWSDFRNPRIVRVSHSFGGKDRHSKVCTIRGLRDRRIRLSVPTAIQLYDLQDRLGLNQPSKVIDWLLDATKMDIDKLPPLQIPPDFGQFFHAPNASHQSSFANTFFNPNLTFLKDGGGAHNSRNNVEGEDITVAEKDEQENQDHGNGGNGQILAQNLFPIPSLMMNNAMPYNYYHWEPSNPSLFPFGSHGFLTQTDHQNPLNNSAAAAAAAAPSGSQFFFCPPAASTPSLFPPPYPTPLESDQLRQINQFQFLSSSSSSHALPNSLTSSLSGKVPFSLDVNSKLLPSKK